MGHGNSLPTIWTQSYSQPHPDSHCLSPLHYTCPTFQSGCATHCSRKTTCIPLAHTDSHIASLLMSSFLHPLSPQGKISPPFEGYVLADIFDKFFSDTLPQNSLLIHLFSKTNLYYPSGHVVPLIGFLFIYPVLFINVLVLWVDSFHEIWKKFDQYFKICFLLHSIHSLLLGVRIHEC